MRGGRLWLFYVCGRVRVYPLPAGAMSPDLVEREFVGPYSVVGQWWRVAPDGRLECYLCPRRCKLRDGQRGFCYVRAAERGRLVLTTYGRASGFCIDPIEKKPLFHFYPGTSVLSFGTAGCNLGCRFCQNWDISKAREDDRLTSRAMPADIAEAARIRGCRSIAFTYNDPVIFAEYAIDTAEAAHARGVKTVAVTAGYISPEARREFFSRMDAANVDLKAFTKEFYGRVCLGRLEPVLDTLEWIRRETDVWLEVTTLLIPGFNDSDRELRELCGWVADRLGPDVPLHFTAFHPDYKMMDVPPTPPATLRRAREIALAAGLRYVYTGNVTDPEGQSTYCPSCGSVVVGRNWYRIESWNLVEGGRCGSCGHTVAGRFDPRPGRWGGGREPIVIRPSRGVVR